MIKGQGRKRISGAVIATSVGSAAFPLLAPDGGSSAPSYSFSSSPLTGIYYFVGPGLGFTINGGIWMAAVAGQIKLRDTAQFGWVNSSSAQTSALDTTLARVAAGFVGVTSGFRVPPGSVNAPSYAFASEADKGFYDSGNDAITVAVNGANWITMFAGGIRFRDSSIVGWCSSNSSNGTVDTTLARVAVGFVGVTAGFQVPDGSAAAPSYSFASSPGTGLRWDAGNAGLRIGINGTSVHLFTGSTYVIVSNSGQFRLGASNDTVLSRIEAGVFGMTTGLALGTNPASAGAVRLANATAINFRNAANNADLTGIEMNSSNQLRVGAGGTANVRIADNAGAAVGFFAVNSTTRQVGGYDITNNVTAGGTTGVLANYTDLTVYANDSAAIRNNVYQLAEAVRICQNALRRYGLLT